MNRLLLAALLATCAPLLSASPACALQISLDTISPADSAAAANAPLFQSHDVLEFTLEADLRQIRRDRDELREERPARLTLSIGERGPMTFDIKVRTQGGFRLQKRHCNLPLLDLNFKRQDVPGTVFENQNKIRLVTPCRDGEREYEQLLLQEYLAYRVYNLFTTASLRVRLVRVTYVDTSGQSDSFTRYGFLVEHFNTLAVRHRMTELDMRGLSDLEMDMELMALTWVFQYAIANTDWEVSALHNIVLFVDEDQIPIAIPYDFDWSGVVAAPYARPDPQLGIDDVRTRLYRGYCIPEEDARALLDPVFARFNEKKDDIYALYASVPLEEKRLRETIEYYDRFYVTISDAETIKREFIRKCRRLS